MNMHRSDWTAGLVGLFHRFGVQAFGWDAQEVRHLRELLAMGIDAVYSDHVARMVATVGEFTLTHRASRSHAVHGDRTATT